MSVKPFLKWPGGKSRLLPQLRPFFPVELRNSEIENYCEPFLGSGALFFDIVNKYRFKRVRLGDINKELILIYKVVQNDINKLLKFLERYKSEYLVLDIKDRKKYFYEMRSSFNLSRFNIDYENYSDNWISRASQLMFLNKTCFNGLFRFNQKGAFNSPYGSYKKPAIYDENNLLAVSRILENVEIVNKDFVKTVEPAGPNTFIYFDPPYKPISKTSSFTSYSKDGFGDNDQLRLAEILEDIDKSGAKFMLSNSEPKNTEPENNFFEQLYGKFNIENVYAPRMINCKGNLRGMIKEIVVTNYKLDIN